MLLSSNIKKSTFNLRFFAESKIPLLYIIFYYKRYVKSLFGKTINLHRKLSTFSAAVNIFGLGLNVPGIIGNGEHVGGVKPLYV